MSAARRVRRRRRWPKVVAAVLVGPLLVLGLALFLLYRSVAVEVDSRLAGLHDRVAPKVYARPFVLRTGQALTSQELDERLDDLGYTRKDRAVAPGEFDVRATEIRLVPRGGTAEGQVVRIVLSLDTSGRSGQVASLESARTAGTDMQGPVASKSSFDLPEPGSPRTVPASTDIPSIARKIAREIAQNLSQQFSQSWEHR